MKKILYFDCSAGISGDMTLGALIHLGVDIEALKAELSKLNITGYAISAQKGRLNGISGINLIVETDDVDDGADAGANDNDGTADGNGADNDNGADDAVAAGADIHELTLTNNEPHAHAHEHSSVHDHRSFKDILELIERSRLNDNVKKTASDIFRVIAEAEGAVHDIATNEVVFHEVGAVDSIIDIVGAAICIDMLNVDDIYCSPVHDGYGSIRCRHGLIPVPVPAVVEMLKHSEIQIISEDVPTEMVTPTGLGILIGLNAKCGVMPQMKLLGAGYGFGKRCTGRFNALRIIMGQE